MQGGLVKTFFDYVITTLPILILTFLSENYCDVVGFEEQKKRMRRFAIPFAFNSTSDRGTMIWGPSGVGKRHFAKGGLISESFSLWHHVQKSAKSLS
jgi:hypothetical protein